MRGTTGILLPQLHHTGTRRSPSGLPTICLIVAAGSAGDAVARTLAASGLALAWRAELRPALERLRKGRPVDMIIAELAVDGARRLPRIREAAGRVPIIALLPKGQKDDGEAGLEAIRNGADEWLANEELGRLDRVVRTAWERHLAPWRDPSPVRR